VATPLLNTTYTRVGSVSAGFTANGADLGPIGTEQLFTRMDKKRNHDQRKICVEPQYQQKNLAIVAFEQIARGAFLHIFTQLRTSLLIGHHGLLYLQLLFCSAMLAL